jgi:hypothetical protein
MLRPEGADLQPPGIHEAMADWAMGLGDDEGGSAAPPK